MNSKFAPLSVSVASALLLSHLGGSAEIIDTAGENGTRGIDGMNPGQSGGNGTSGASLNRSAINLLDAVKSITLRAGAGGGGNSSSPIPRSLSITLRAGAGGGGVVLWTPAEESMITLRAGAGGGGR